MSEIFSSKTMINKTVPMVRVKGYMTPVMYVGLGAITPADTLRIAALLQSTNENEFTVAWNVFVTLNEGGIQLANKIGYSTGRNLLRDIHHDGLSLFKLIKPQITYEKAYIGMFCTAKPLTGSALPPPKSVLDLNYGELMVEIQRGVS